MTEEEIQSKLRELTDDQLVHLRNEARKRDTPQCWALRYFIIREGLRRWTERQQLTR